MERGAPTPVTQKALALHVGQPDPRALAVRVAGLDSQLPRAGALEHAGDFPASCRPASEVRVPMARDVVWGMKLDVFPVRLANPPIPQTVVVDLRTALVWNNVPTRFQRAATTGYGGGGRSLRQIRTTRRYNHGHDWRSLAADDARIVCIPRKILRDVDAINLASQCVLVSDGETSVQIPSFRAVDDFHCRHTRANANLICPVADTGQHEMRQLRVGTNCSPPTWAKRRTILHQDRIQLLGLVTFPIQLKRLAYLLANHRRPTRYDLAVSSRRAEMAYGAAAVHQYFDRSRGVFHLCIPLLAIPQYYTSVAAATPSTAGGNCRDYIVDLNGV